MTSRPSTAAPILAALAIVLLPVIYLLGIGPVGWLWEHKYISDAAKDIYCAPILAIADYEWARGFINLLLAYLRLWGVGD